MKKYFTQLVNLLYFPFCCLEEGSYLFGKDSKIFSLGKEGFGA